MGIEARASAVAEIMAVIDKHSLSVQMATGNKERVRVIIYELVAAISEGLRWDDNWEMIEKMVGEITGTDYRTRAPEAESEARLSQ